LRSRIARPSLQVSGPGGLRLNGRNVTVCQWRSGRACELKATQCRRWEHQGGREWQQTVSAGPTSRPASNLAASRAIHLRKYKGPPAPLPSRCTHAASRTQRQTFRLSTATAGTVRPCPTARCVRSHARARRQSSRLQHPRDSEFPMRSIGIFNYCGYVQGQAEPSPRPGRALASVRAGPDLGKLGWTG
jgi:hypothetical protein